MNTEFIREYCLAKPSVTEGFPFGNHTLVFKLRNKIFLILSLSDDKTFNSKCNPDYAVTLRTKYSQIVPGYHMNKTHWNTVTFGGNLPNNLITELIDHSYQLIYNSLPKVLQKP